VIVTLAAKHYEEFYDKASTTKF